MNTNELEKIITFGVMEKEFHILKFRVLMRSLTSGEISDIMKETSGYDETAKVTESQIKSLARSIQAINGKPIQYIAKEENESITEYKKIQQNENIIRKWQKSILDLFFNKYIELVGAQNDFLSDYQTTSEKSGVDKSGKQPSSSE